MDHLPEKSFQFDDFATETCLVGGWAYPSEKYEFVNGKDNIP